MGITYKEGNDSPPDSYYEDPETGLACPECWEELGKDTTELVDDEVKTCRRHVKLRGREWDD